MQQFYLGVFLVFLSASGFGLIPIFARYAYEGGASVTTLLFLRFTMASLFFFSYLFFKEGKIKVARHQLKSLLLLGGILYTMQSSLYFSAVKFIPASLAVLLFYSYPIFVAVASSLVNKEKMTKDIVFSILISLVGLILVLGSTFQSINGLGIVLAVGAALVYCVYLVLGTRVVENLPALVTSSFVCLFAAISLLIIGLSTDQLSFDLTGQAWAAVVGVALCCTVLAMFTLFKGLELIGSTRTSILSMIEPLVTIGFSVVLFSEQLSWLQMLGGAAVLAGAVLVITAKDKVAKDNVRGERVDV